MHILLRPVPGLSVNPWKDAKPLPSSLPQNAPTWTALYRAEHRLPSPRNKLAPRGTRKNAPHATRGRLARLAAEPAVIGAGSTRAPHRSLSAAVVASPSLCRSREPPSRRKLQSAARDDPSRRSLSGSPSARRPLPDRLPKAARSPDLSPARNHPITGWGCRGPGTPDQKAGWTRIPPCGPPRATARSRGLRAGWAERGAFRPPGYSAGMAECSVSYACIGAHRPEGRRDEPDGVLWSRRARGLTTPDGGGTPDANELAIGRNGVPADRLIEHSGRGQVRTWRDEQRPAREFLAGPQSVRADEPCSHDVRHRGDDVAGNIVAGEQHLSLRASGRRQHKVVEEGPACGTQAGMRAKRSGTGR